MTMIGGQKKMLVWNDLVADEKIRVYDKGVQITSGDKVRELLVSYRSGDMWAPQLEQLEALRVELDYFADCILHNKTPFNDGHGRPAGGAHARSGRPLHQAEGRIGAPVNEYCSIAPDVRLGKGVKLSKFINLYGCEIGDDTKIGAFVEIQKNAAVGRRCKISSHTFICEGVTIEDNVFIGHGVTFINDIYPRATAQRPAADRGRLESGPHGGQAGRVYRIRRHDSRQRHHRRERHRRRGQRGHQGRAGSNT